ncbi:MAG TPA: SAM-dependent methyltransferase, partial [Aquabacterium sp.]|nr:SAM-dependent methyltransferase [Aquabacterium sp.]
MPLPDLTQRADQQIVALGLAPTRSAAQRLIDQGGVQWHGPKGWTTVRKAGEALPIKAEFKLVDDAETRWVSRAGLKLEGALKHCAGSKPTLPLKAKVCLDVGQSTGGFTEVLLAQGAKRVVGVDVGHGQVHSRVREHPQVAVIEGVNARHMTAEDLGDVVPPAGFALIVGDLSFISLTLVLPALVPLLSAKGELLMLVKPQFELQPAQIGKGGLVKDPASYDEVEARIRGA